MEPCIGLETHIAITHSHGFDGFGHWDRLCERHPALDFWGRDERVDHRWSSWQLTRSGHPVKIPYIIQRGFGNMHLDDWIAPDELVQHIKSEHDKKRMLLQMICEQGKAVTKAKGVFEVKLNVQDFHPHELRVRTCYGLVTVTGTHEGPETWENEVESHDCGLGGAARSFRRTFTLPKNMLEDQLQCKLTDDGHLIFCGPVTVTATASDVKGKEKLEEVPVNLEVKTEESYKLV